MFKHVFFFVLVLEIQVLASSSKSFSKDRNTIVTPNDPDNQNSYTQPNGSSQVASTSSTNVPAQSGMSSTPPSSPLSDSGGSDGVPPTVSTPRNSNPAPGSIAGSNANGTPEGTPANNGNTSSEAGSTTNGTSGGSIPGNNGPSPNGTRGEGIPEARTPGNNASSSSGRSSNSNDVNGRRASGVGTPGSNASPEEGNTSPGRGPPENNNSSSGVASTSGVGPNGMGPPGRVGFRGFRNVPETHLNIANRKRNSKYKNVRDYVKDVGRYQLKNLYEVNSEDNSKIPKHADCFGFGIPRSGQTTTSTTPSTPTTSDNTQIDQRLRARRRTPTQRRNG